MLGTSDAWSMSLLSRYPSKPAYYIVDWQILGGHYGVKIGPLSYWMTLRGSTCNYRDLVPQTSTEFDALLQVSDATPLESDQDLNFKLGIQTKFKNI